MSVLIRIGGGLIVAIAILLLARAPAVAGWLGRPVGWSVLWESFRGKGTVGDAVYEGYSIYTTIAGKFSDRAVHSWPLHHRLGAVANQNSSGGRRKREAGVLFRGQVSDAHPCRGIACCAEQQRNHVARAHREIIDPDREVGEPLK